MPIVESKTVTTNTAVTAPVSASAALVLEDGRIFRGSSYGATGTALGEAVFATGMTGYQETITDPSYARQLVVQTAPHIGNTGVNNEDAESRRIWVAGYVVRDAARRPSNWRSERSLDEELVAQGIVGIQGVDTRAITRHLREHKTMRAGIFSGEAAEATDKELLDAVLASAPMEGARLAEEVSIDEAYVVEPRDHGWDGEPRFSIAAIDLGIKAMTPVRFAERGVRVHVLPATATLADVKAVNPDGFFMSNGPGDPATADAQVKLLRSVLDEKLPYFGICFGNQILGRALGFGTYKLKYGHRGINQPVLDRRTGKVEITSQNHGFAVDAPLDGATQAPEARYGRVEVSHVSLNDDVVEGLACLDIPAFSVQYHPEAAAGPHDAAYLFDRFIELMEGTRDGRTANLSKEPVDSAHPAAGTAAGAGHNDDNKTEDKK
ncbi:glutamine-hydrolyzing carbamoyl-phosphate synthase small subunit [Arthrobacter sp. AB6]|uniref:glutamine-hydrolyzing carbamoyl-phosphate synthase small subunit n=1 Tax=Arthrobacter sp. AB6 TaxID=2962570 RepID=UPI002882D11E|nr:glutamine-hydrolyzing carbamoyl-phosphate synthase small subunit [Arthrobacter sp. AB6]MDT0195952.1 glutamine-hydrolyzing carbamoyl-phosphate synthase small subunit [Arthrobacter sp. AB6]